MITVQLYSKPECSLCDEAKAVLLEVQQRFPFRLVETDISEDGQLFQRYQYDIPLVFIEGRKAFKHRVDASSFEDSLRRLSGI